MIEYPSIFYDNDYVNIVAGADVHMLLADALCAWGCVRMGKASGVPLPENFGNVMARISGKLKVSGTPESLMELSDRLFPKGTEPGLPVNKDYFSTS